MVEYIERTEALEITTRTCGDYAAAWSEIRKLPAADVAPVVRCENCVDGIESDDNKYIICCRFGIGMEFDDFCSHGEGKNGGSDYATY